MKRLIATAEVILKSPITNLVLAIMFLYSGISEAMEDYQAKETGIRIHHGVAMYGLILFVKSFVAILKVLRGMRKHREEPT